MDRECDFYGDDCSRNCMAPLGPCSVFFEKENEKLQQHIKELEEGYTEMRQFFNSTLSEGNEIDLEEWIEYIDEKLNKSDKE